MNSTRISWSRMSVEEACAELHRLSFKRKLSKAAPIDCLVCGDTPDKDEWVYYPSEHPNSQTNKTIVHVDCALKQLGKLKKEAAAQQIDKTVLRVVQPQAKPSELARVDAKVASGYHYGWMLGAIFAFERSQVDIGDFDDDTLKGFNEGCTFGMLHKPR